MATPLEPPLIYTLLALGGYLLGSIPFGLVLTRMAGHGDIRDIGSKSIGATNVLRTGNKLLAFLTLVGDSGKGAAALLIAQHWGSDAGLIAGFMAVVGHNFPVWLKFKGGKGVAATLGVLIFGAFPVGAATCATWLLIAALFRYSSLAALISLSTAPFYAWYLNLPNLAIMAAALAALAILRHHQNITRLLKGEESKIGGKS